MDGLERPRFEVPEVRVAPPIAGPGLVAFVDHLFTVLMELDSGSMVAEWTPIGFQFKVSDRRGNVKIVKPDMEPGTEQSIFRTILAKIGNHYMSVQLYGGYSEIILTQNGRTRLASIYMANDGWRGYWIRVYTKSWPGEPS
jgi:hypothetical protein